MKKPRREKVCERLQPVVEDWYATWANRLEARSLTEIEQILRYVGWCSDGWGEDLRSVCSEQDETFVEIRLWRPMPWLPEDGLFPRVVTKNGEWLLCFRRSVFETNCPSGRSPWIGRKDKVFGGVVFKDEAPWQVEIRYQVHGRGSQTIAFGWRAPDAAGQGWAELLARNAWVPVVFKDRADLGQT